MSGKVSDAQETLIKLNLRIVKAEKGQPERDKAFLRDVLADYLRFHRANNTVVEKEQYLANLPNTVYETLEVIDPEHFEIGNPSKTDVTVYEDTAVTSFLLRVKGVRRERQQGTQVENEIRIDGVFRNTRIFQKVGDRWVCGFWFNTQVQ